MTKIVLPKSWTEASLMEVSRVRTGKKDANHAKPNGEHRFYTCAYNYVMCDTKSFEGECLILPGNGANVGEVFYYNGNFEAYQRTYVIENIELIPKFLFYHLLSNWKKVNSDKQYGTATNYIRIGNFEDYRVNIPPLNEQTRIVARIEELCSELDKGVESLKTARAQLKVYRQVVLKHAFEGKLTAQWREDNKDKLETADELLERIQNEREGRYQEKLEYWQISVSAWEENGKEGKKPAKPRVPKKISELESQALSKLGSLPDSWFWGKLGHMTCGVGYGTSAKSQASGKVPVLRMGNIQNSKFDWSDLVYTSDSVEISQYILNQGDVLFNRTNSPELVGKTAIYKGEQPAIFAGYLIRVNQISSIVKDQYLNSFLNSHTAKQHGNTVKTDGVNQSNINGEKLSNYPFPYCSLLEQSEIVRILEEKLSIIDNTVDELNTKLKNSEALRQSILKKAFSGKLVAQDPNDEPASVLLERIKAEKINKKKKEKAA